MSKDIADISCPLC